MREELANEIKRKFECLGENTEKCKNFSFPIEKVMRKIENDGDEDIITISYKIKFIDTARLIASSLSNIANNLA